MSAPEAILAAVLILMGIAGAIGFYNYGRYRP